ncbi:hypothetical protein ACETIH_01805 [Microvirga arabica]|uniref:Uncharacterized protein n=1 Tax=Microvirga arabica TaxID=1128671 RepID=A0ABV6Y3A2_9HYPH
MLEWFPQPVDAFLVGAFIVGAVQYSRYKFVLAKKEGMEEWISLLGTLRTRDFSGPETYRVGLLVYLGISLLAYFLICKISPETLSGALQLSGAPGETVSNLSKYNTPLYVAAVFLGASTVLGDRMASVIDGVTAFFQDRIDVPNRVVTSAKEVLLSLKQESKSTPQELAKWMKKIDSREWFDNIHPLIDSEFAANRLARVKADLLQDVNHMSKREMVDVLDRVVKIIIVAGARKSGAKGIAAAKEFVLVSLTGKTSKPHPTAQRLLASMSASLLILTVALFVVYITLVVLDGSVAKAFDTDPHSDGWPGEPGRLGYEMLLSIVPFIATIVICLGKSARISRPATQSWRVADNLPRYSPVLLRCLIFNFLILWVARLTSVGIYGTGSTLTVEYIAKFSALFLIQGTIPIGLGYILLASLERQGFRIPTKSKFILIGAGTVSTALLAAVAFTTYRILVPQIGVGYEFVLFGVLINAFLCAIILISLLVFLLGEESRSRADHTEPLAGATA